MTQVLRQSTQVVVRIGPFVDVTDGFTPETGVTLSGADEAELLKAAGAATVSIAGNTWAAISGADGWYDLTLSTTDTNTIGTADVVVNDDSVCLPVFARFQIIEEAAYDALYASSAAPATAAGVSAVETDTQDIQGRLPAALTGDGNIKADTLRVGGTLQTAGDIMADTNDIQTRLPAALVSGRMDASVGAMAAAVLTATAIAADAITDAKVASDVTIASVTGAVGSVTGNVGGNVVGSVGSLTTNNDKTGYALTSGERTSIADALLDRDMATGTDSGSTTVRTVRQALRLLRNKWDITGGTLTVKKEDDATTSWAAAVTGTAGADPVTQVDPAGP